MTCSVADGLALQLCTLEMRHEVSSQRDVDCPHIDRSPMGPHLEWCTGCGALRVVYPVNADCAGLGPWYTPRGAP